MSHKTINIHQGTSNPSQMYQVSSSKICVVLLDVTHLVLSLPPLIFHHHHSNCILKPPHLLTLCPHTITIQSHLLDSNNPTHTISRFILLFCLLTLFNRVPYRDHDQEQDRDHNQFLKMLVILFLTPICDSPSFGVFAGPPPLPLKRSLACITGSRVGPRAPAGGGHHRGAAPLPRQRLRRPRPGGARRPHTLLTCEGRGRALQHPRRSETQLGILDHRFSHCCFLC